MDKKKSLNDEKKVNKISWYADFSELTENKNINIPNVIIFGGVIVDDLSKYQLWSAISKIKSKYNETANFPLKWCFKDLENYYKKNKQIRLYKKLLEDITSWREQIFEQLASLPFRFIISIIKSHAQYRESLKESKEKVIRFAFVMTLQKYGLCVRNNNMSAAEVILDWPPGGNKQIFDIEYRSAFYSGKSAEYGQQYDCGPLKKIGFNDSVLFSSMTECSMLQISDLIIGAFRDLLKEAFGNKTNLHGVKLLRTIKNRLYGAPNNLNYGISISPDKKTFSDIIWIKIKEVLGSRL
ncbi:MAG: DUF3800 domain-containing protein [Candidatus Aminicenantes bacterium]|nr:DUF3800 domain-containing protein [Candidatus Aminicenantes bacterium]